jgi:pyridoxine 5-phosphate synthase
MNNMVKLGVNIDHIATIRQARKAPEPDPVTAAAVCELNGAEGITVHLREDRRHINDRDVRLLRQTIKTKLNLEMAAVDEITGIAVEIKPDDVCLVPERRQELTTEGGLDVAGQKKHLEAIIKRLKSAGITVSLFIDPDDAQIKAASEIGADCVELHTGKYAGVCTGDFRYSARYREELERLKAAGALAVGSGLILNAGHGLDYRNALEIAQISGMNELNIGFAIIARAVFTGLGPAVEEMKRLITVNGQL